MRLDKPFARQIKPTGKMNPSSTVLVGSWILEETENGDLQVRHAETGVELILVTKEQIQE